MSSRKASRSQSWRLERRTWRTGRDLRTESFHALTRVADFKATKPEEPDMTMTQERGETATKAATARAVDMKLEVVVIPVSDVERAKRFYGGLGWRLDADFVGDTLRGGSFTPTGPPSRLPFRQ